MIAHNLALGKRVLFVAEKLTALEVVHRRLAEKGLGSSASNFTLARLRRRRYWRNLERAWDIRDALSAEEWAREAGQVKRLRDRLNDVVRLLHKRHSNGLTLHWRSDASSETWTPDTPDLGWQGAGHDALALDNMREIARRLDLNRQTVRELPEALSVVMRASGVVKRLAGAHPGDGA